MKKILKLFVLTLVLAGAGYGGYTYFQYQARYPSTDDAYVQANVVHIAPQVSGEIDKVYVKNFQYVSKGQPLFDIESTTYALAIIKAKANLDITQQQINAAKSAVATAKSLVAQRQADLDSIQKASRRTMIMVQRKIFPRADADTATRNLKVAKAALAAAKNKLNQAQENLGDDGPNNASLRAAQTALAQAQLDLSYTHVTAPASGYITQLDLTRGTEVRAFQPAFSLITDQVWWTNANFKETQLARIRPGQTATITVDMYPDHPFKGRVVSISAGSGASFSILPPENASGNWVKVTQRFPVRIAISNPDPNYPLRMGASTRVTVDTTHTS